MQKLSFQSQVNLECEVIFKLLHKREEDWNKEQNILQNKKIMEKIDKAKTQSLYTTKLLASCKSWDGPVTSAEELQDILVYHPDIAE